MVVRMTLEEHTIATKLIRKIEELKMEISECDYLLKPFNKDDCVMCADFYLQEIDSGCTMHNMQIKGETGTIVHFIMNYKEILEHRKDELEKELEEL